MLATKMLARGSVLVSTERAIHLLPEGRRFLTAEQEERGEPVKKMSSRIEKSEIRHFDLLNNWLVAGGSNGILSVGRKNTTLDNNFQCGRLVKQKSTKLIMFTFEVKNAFFKQTGVGLGNG